MNARDIETKLRELVCDRMNCQPSEVLPESRFREDLGLDSLDAIELQFEVEEAFDCDLPDDEVEACKTFSDAVALVKRLLEA